MATQTKSGKAATGNAVRPEEEARLSLADSILRTIAQNGDDDVFSQPAGMFSRRTRELPMQFGGYDFRGGVTTPFAYVWSKDKKKKCVCNCEFLWNGEAVTVEDTDVEDPPETGTLYLVGAMSGSEMKFYVESEKGSHYSQSDYKCKLYEFSNGRLVEDYRLSFLPPPPPSDDQATFKLRVTTDEEGTSKLQVFIADPGSAVTWNDVALSPKNAGVNIASGWCDAGEAGFGSSSLYLNLKVVVHLQETEEKRTITGSVNGESMPVEHTFLVYTFVSAEGEYSISTSRGTTKCEPLAKEESGGGKYKAELEHSVLLGMASASGAVNNILGAQHYVDFLGWSTGLAASDSTSTATETTGTETTGTETTKPGTETTKPDTTKPTETTTPSPSVGESFDFVGSVRFQCPYLQQRIDHYDAATGKVTKGTWATIEGGVCTPHSEG